jgi:hypothetical protein
MKIVHWIIFLAGVGSLWAHDVHETLGEAEWNGKTGALEVSVRCFVSDLELALMRRFERRAVLGVMADAEWDELLKTYVKERFVLRQADGSAVELEWVGRKVAAGEEAMVELFFQLRGVAGLAGCSLEHGLLMECFADQRHLLLLIMEKTRVQMKFTAEAKVQPLAGKELDRPSGVH